MGSRTAFISLLVAVVTLVTNVAYFYKMVVLTELTTEATLFNTLYAEYSTPQMADALRAVEDFSHATELSTQQIVCKGAEERLWEKKFDNEWQRLFHWYQKIVYFHRMGLLSDRFYAEFPGPIHARHFVQHVEPFALNSCKFYEEERLCSDVFDYLRKLYSLPAVKKVVCGKETPKQHVDTNEEL